ncbi:MAG TPA: purine-nucleoside phosphorylase [Bacteroidales bacterium]|nr:purine-nucleoside phosphorylase [Bacteroidales bacterium]
MLEKIKETTAFIQAKIGEFKPVTGIVLGTGLGNLAKEIETHIALNYSEIPNFPISTVVGHAGKLVFGAISGHKVVAMQGRFHYYEGYTMQELTFPIRVMKFLGIEQLFLSNAAGGTNPEFKVGDIMVINDHINLFYTNPLIGPNDDKLGPRFPDMHDAYDKQLIDKAFEIAKQHGIKLQQGVYAAVSGPCFETPAEYGYIRILGADAIGMSTIPEVIVARHMGLKCFAVSVITDLGIKGMVVKVSHEEVLEAATKAEPILTKLVKGMLATF